MNIAIDLTALDDNFTGIERYAVNMTLELLRQDKEDTFDLLFKNAVFSDFSVWSEKSNVNFHIIKGCGKLLFNQWRLPHYLNRLQADYYLFFAFPMPLLLRKKHVLGTIHDLGCWDCPETMKRQMVWYFRLSYLSMARRAEYIMTVSEFSRKRIMDILKVQSEKIILTYNGLSEQLQEIKMISEYKKQATRKKYGLPEEYYLCLSTLEPRKNMLFLLKNYLELYQQNRIHTKLVLAGRCGWKIDELLAEANAEKDGQVIITGFIEDEDLSAVYQMAKCFLFPSFYEGFGIPPLEAMAQGVPVISSDSSSLPEVLGEGAYYFKNGDSSDLKRVWLEFEKETAEKLELHRQYGYEKSRQYRYEKEAAKILKMIK